MSLNIGLDGSRIAKKHYTGTEHYSHAIFTHMFRVAPHHTYTIYAPRKPTKPLDTGNATVHWRIMPFPKLWTQVRLSAEFLTSSAKPDVLFVPSHTIPMIHPNATVTTVHDLGFRHFPEYYGRIERMYQNFGLWQATRVSTRIITVSNATKKDVVSMTNFPKDSVTVVHHGVNRDVLHPPVPSEKPSKKQKKVSPYLYSIGRLEAKKNTPRLLQAFRILKEKYDIPHQLVLAGKPGSFGFEEVESTLTTLPPEVRQQIHLLGYVSDEDHGSWLRFSSCLVFPSGFEGFGLPALEAMASDVPVVASSTSSLPEIVGDAGVLVNHSRAEAIAEGTMQILGDAAQRANVIKKGRQRIKEFSWERSASKTVGVLETAVREVNHAR